MSAAPHWIGLRTLDETAGTAKGAAFRQFKRLSGHWQEGVDYCVLDHARDARQITALKNSGEVYASSVQVILVSPATAAQLLKVLSQMDPA